MFVTGPNVVKTVTNEEISSEDLGGAMRMPAKSGVAQLTSANDVECIAQIKSYLLICRKTVKSAFRILNMKQQMSAGPAWQI